MRNKIIIVLTGLLLMIIACSKKTTISPTGAQPNAAPTAIPCNTFKTYGGAGFNSAQAITNSNDGGFVFTGATSAANGRNQIYIVKTDSTGSIQWQKTYGWQYDNIGSYILKLSDGYLVSANVDLLGRDYTEDTVVALIKTDFNGDCVWARTYESLAPPPQLCSSIYPTIDGDYALAIRLYNIMLLKVDATGNCLLAVALDTGSSLCCGSSQTSVVQEPSGNYMLTDMGNIAGCSSTGGSPWQKYLNIYSNGSNERILPNQTGSYTIGIDNSQTNTFMLVNVDSSGNCLSSRSYAVCNTWCQMMDMASTAGGGWVMCGQSDNNMFIMAVDSAQNPIWQKSFPCSIDWGRAFTGVVQAPDGSFVACGSISLPSNKAVLAKFDGSGNLIW